MKSEGEILCFSCYQNQSPFIDEAWRIIADVIDYGLVWVDSESIERRKRHIVPTTSEYKRR
jgi:hypothetical protein